MIRTQHGDRVKIYQSSRNCINVKKRVLTNHNECTCTKMIIDLHLKITCRSMIILVHAPTITLQHSRMLEAK